VVGRSILVGKSRCPDAPGLPLPRWTVAIPQRDLAVTHARAEGVGVVPPDSRLLVGS